VKGIRYYQAWAEELRPEKEVVCGSSFPSSSSGHEQRDAEYFSVPYDRLIIAVGAHNGPLLSVWTERERERKRAVFVGVCTYYIMRSVRMLCVHLEAETEAATFGIPGVAENAMFLKELEHARKIRLRIVEVRLLYNMTEECVII
jgi:NADH dehydrogenase FAD-containing subunit